MKNSLLEMPRLLVYSQDGTGLGHLRRTRNIAQQVLAREPCSSMLVVADSPAAPFFSPLIGVDYLKLPTIVKTGSNDWRAATLPMEIRDTVTLRTNLILETFREFNPDVILVDHMPVGALGELKPLLESALQRPNRPRLFLGLRDVLDAPDVIRRVWTELGAYEYLPCYDTVLIYGCSDLYDASSAYGLTPHAREMAYCNYVTHSHQAPRATGLEDEPLVLVMGGGGGDAYPLFKTFLEAVPILLEATPLRAVILTGPNMPDCEREALLSQAPPPCIQIRGGWDDATSWLPQASAVVTMAGYNSLGEVLKWRKPALIVPRSGPSAEQRIRSRLFSKRRLVRTLDPEKLNPQRLARELTQLLLGEVALDWANVPPLDGAERVAKLLVNGLRGGEEEDDASPTSLAASGG